MERIPGRLDEADLPAQEAPPRQGARLPRPHEDDGRTPRPGRAPGSRSQAPVGLTVGRGPRQIWDKRVDGEPIVQAYLFRALYVDGGVTIQRFLREGLIHRIIVTRIPILLGSGLPLFGDLPRDVHLQHVATRTFSNGLVQSEYLVSE